MSKIATKMSMREQEDKLFCEWANGRDQFVWDGVVCEREYLKSKSKIVIILKEPNESNGEDLREQLGDGIGYLLWCNVARWVYGIKNRKVQSKLDWREFPEMKDNVELRKEMFREICIMNLKKAPGKGHTVDKELDHAAMEDKDFLEKQYKIYNPDITICGGSSTYWLFKKVMGYCSEDKCTTRGINWYERSANKYVIEFSHPSRPLDTTLMLYPLIDAVNEIYGR